MGVPIVTILSPDQVRLIRKLDKEGWPVAEITNEVGALNDAQVKGVLSGKNYGRMT